MPNRLAEYRRKRDFAATPEPQSRPRHRAARNGARFVVHLHHARSRHFDLRLQVGNTLRSWAVPKGPSLDPEKKRLAVEVEDHPLEYGNFEGTIPQGHYGAGQVWIWDEGRWVPEGDADAALKSGHLKFKMEGSRLRGSWSLIRTRIKNRKPQWLLIKSHDAAEAAGDEADNTPLSEWQDGGHRYRASGSVSKTKPTRKPNAKQKAPPSKIGLQLARLSEQAPIGKDWLHEVKFDGYRVLLWRDGEKIQITSRGDQDWSDKLSDAATAVAALPCGNCVLDGELIAIDEKGRSSFGRLQKVFGENGQQDQLVVMLFDLLYLDGKDFRSQPQIQRKQRLEQLLKGAAAPLCFVEHLIGNGLEAAQESCVQGFEGIISKRLDAPYEEGRGGAWLKIKCVQSEEYAVIGYTAGKGARARLGSLLLATPGSGPRAAWRYMGRVGTGLDDALIKTLLQRMSKLSSAVKLAAPLQPAQLRGAKPQWVKPELVVEVEFRGFTEDGLLRQASLKGLREDRSATSLKPRQRNRASVSVDDADDAKEDESGVRLTHADRVLFRDPPITKQEVAQFYTDIAEFILPGMVGRPLLLMRCPEGGEGECFFQKHISPGFPSSVHEVLDVVEKRRWIYIDDLDGLLGLVQMSALEYHVWGSTAQDLDRADRLVIDLDPAEDVAWKQVVKTALELRDRLEDLKLKSFVRSTGGKGLHVVMPLRPAIEWDAARDFTHALAETLAREQPQRYVAVASKARRNGKIFIDYLRNGRGATAVTSYSLRNRPGTPIATPLGWDELPRLRSAQQFGYANIRRRLARLSEDPWSGIDRLRQKLPVIE